jgi:hypothetical protein
MAVTCAIIKRSLEGDSVRRPVGAGATKPPQQFKP